MLIYFRVLWRRKLLIILTTLGAVAVVVGAMSRTAPYYTASTRLRVVPFGINTPDYGTYLYFEQLSKTFTVMLESDAIKDEARKRLELERLPEVKISEIAGTELLQIVVTSENAEEAFLVSNTLASLLIERVQSQYLANVDNIESTIGARIALLDSEIGQLIQEWTPLQNQVPRDNARVAALEREIATREDTRNQLIASYNQALVAQTTQANAISIVEPATLPVEPTEPNRLLNLAVVGALGLAAGIALVFSLETMNPQIHSEKLLEEISGFCVIGRIPRLRRSHSSNVFEKSPASAESLRKLRARIVQVSDTNVGRTILVVSPDERINSVGVTANVAISLTGVYPSVVVLDANSRKPSLHRLWDLPNRAGFSDVLNGRAKASEVLQKGPVQGLQVITAGTPDRNAVERMASAAFVDLLYELQQESDIIVLNGAPLMPYADSVTMSERVSGILLVIREQSSKKEIEMAHRELQHVASKVLGIVLIDAR